MRSDGNDEGHILLGDMHVPCPTRRQMSMLMLDDGSERFVRNVLTGGYLSTSVANGRPRPDVFGPDDDRTQVQPPLATVNRHGAG
ncbi:MAG: hypothetical protein MUQ10_05365 [Anaerolineae bacterium]|nr:hypothetical protein [Anaerolineae bacterium]